MELHHSKHHNTYVTGANTALEKMEEAGYGKWVDDVRPESDA